MLEGAEFSFPLGSALGVGDFDSLFRPGGGLDMAETDRDADPEDPAESFDIRRLLIGIREVGESLRAAFRVPELGGVG